MDTNNRFKVWGRRDRVLLTETTEIDLLHLKKDCFCSTHNHKSKINRFTVVVGRVKIECEYGTTVLTEGMSFEIRPPLKHRFFGLEDSIMIESAYVEEGTIDADDIDRESQGGRIVDGKELTLEEMREKGLLDL